jgi:hypothetical protein
MTVVKNEKNQLTPPPKELSRYPSLMNIKIATVTDGSLTLVRRSDR